MMDSLQLDPEVLKGWANDDVQYENSSLIRRCGGNISEPIPCGKCLLHRFFAVRISLNNSNYSLSDGVFIFENTGMEDWAIGLLILFISLVALCGTLICLVKILHSMMKGKCSNLHS